VSSVRVNVEDGDDEFVLTAELPEFETDDVDVRVTDSTLRLEAEHGREPRKKRRGNPFGASDTVPRPPGRYPSRRAWRRTTSRPRSIAAS